MNNFRKHKQRSSGFTTIPNDIFMNKNLSMKAIGLLCRLLSLPENWNFSEDGLVAITKDGKAAVRSAIKELEANKYLHRERVRDENGRLGRIMYHIYEEPYEPVEQENGSLEYSPQVPSDYYYNWMQESLNEGE